MRTYDPLIDEHDNEVECAVAGCTYTATYDEAEYFEEPMCPWHLDEAYEEVRGELAYERMKEDEERWNR